VSKFFIYTFGCRCNQADSAIIREGLCRNSLKEGESPLDAQLVVVNTCTVTHRTDQQVRQTVRKLHRENPGARLVVTGCYAERDPQSIAAIPGVNLVIGNADKERLAEIVFDEGTQSCVKIIRTPLDAARDYLLPSMRRTGGKTRPFVKIQEGCDARCSYCIIPAVRGPGRSARIDDVLTEVETLIAGGYQEIVLTGVHLGTYGRKLARPVSLAELLRRILQLPGLGRLRLSRCGSLGKLWISRRGILRLRLIFIFHCRAEVNVF
jgi:threonylcarbamoyladenosine tRNA methylthiotransferase MtaB